MHMFKLDLKNGLVLLDSVPITVDDKGDLAGSIAKLCSPPIYTNEGRARYRLLRKASVFEKSADAVIDISEEKVCAITFLFSFIEFFESSILESKILKACEKSLNLKFISSHPSTAFSGLCEWGKAVFFYDAKQGDLSLEITFEHG